MAGVNTHDDRDEFPCCPLPRSLLFHDVSVNGLTVCDKRYRKKEREYEERGLPEFAE